MVGGRAQLLPIPSRPSPSSAAQVIAFLDTGAGKTFVAVLLIQHCISRQRQLAATLAAEHQRAASAAAAAATPNSGHAGELATQPSAAAEAAVEAAAVPPALPHKVAIFLAPKVALVLQQADVLRLHVGPRVAHFVGEMLCADPWDRARCGWGLRRRRCAGAVMEGRGRARVCFAPQVCLRRSAGGGRRFRRTTSSS